MVGQTWQSEIREFADEKTGRTIRQLTSTGNNVHLYFTENSFDERENFIIFRSDRASGEERYSSSHKKPQERSLYNLFRMNLDTGEIIQMTDEPTSVGSVTKTPDSANPAVGIGYARQKGICARLHAAAPSADAY